MCYTDGANNHSTQWENKIMATTRRKGVNDATEAQQTTKPQVGALPTMDALETAETDLRDIRRAPNPYAGITTRPDVLDAEKPRRFGSLTAEQAKAVENLIRRDARENNLGLSLIRRETIDGAWEVVFRSKSTKRKFAATSADIRTWATEQGLPTEVGNVDGKHSSAIPQATRDAYREAHGLPLTKR